MKEDGWDEMCAGEMTVWVWVGWDSRFYDDSMALGEMGCVLVG